VAVTGFIGGKIKIKLLTTATSAAQTITGPASIRAGDILLLNDIAVNTGGTAPSSAIPSGFDLVGSVVLTNITRNNFSWKLADGSEARASLTGMNGNSRNAKLLAVLRPTRAATAITEQSPATNTVPADNPSAQIVPASGGTPPLVVVGAYGVSANPPALDPRTFSISSVDVKDWEASFVSTFEALYIAGKFYLESPADVTVDMDDEGNNFLQSAFLELTF
jgi:hypothetical protein